MAHIDLNAARKARAEADGVVHTVDLGDDQFVFPAIEDWPIEAIDHVREGGFGEAMRIVLGDDYPRFAKHRPTLTDCKDIFEGLAEAQGVGDLPSSSGSSRS